MVKVICAVLRGRRIREDSDLPDPSFLQWLRAGKEMGDCSGLRWPAIA